jgi:outer membrane protein TolC
MLESEKASTLYDISIAQAERMPTVSIAGDVGALGVKASEFHEDLGYSLFLSLDLPLFNWGAIGDRIQQKELASQQLEAEAQLRSREIETEYSVTKSDLEASRNALAGYTDNIARAEENYLTAKSRFAGGAGSNLEVLEAQRLLTEAKLNRSGAQFQVRADRATLLRLAGSR